MDTNIAIAYNNVVVTDLKSIMKAGKITLNIETKEIEINSDQNKRKKLNKHYTVNGYTQKRFKIKNFKQDQNIIEIKMYLKNLVKDSFGWCIY